MKVTILTILVGLLVGCGAVNGGGPERESPATESAAARHKVGKNELQSSPAVDEHDSKDVDSGAQEESRLSCCDDNGEEILTGKTILFSTGSSELDDRNRCRLDQVVSLVYSEYYYFKKKAGHVHIAGFSSTKEGGAITLSRQRADTVKQYLIRHGLRKGLFSSNGYGDACPRENEVDDVTAGRNQRVELKLLVFDGRRTKYQPACNGAFHQKLVSPELWLSNGNESLLLKKVPELPFNRGYCAPASIPGCYSSALPEKCEPVP